MPPKRTGTGWFRVEKVDSPIPSQGKLIDPDGKTIFRSLYLPLANAFAAIRNADKVKRDGK